LGPEVLRSLTERFPAFPGESHLRLTDPESFSESPLTACLERVAAARQFPSVISGKRPLLPKVD